MAFLPASLLMVLAQAGSGSKEAAEVLLSLDEVARQEENASLVPS
jgi:hypothetical protein